MTVDQYTILAVLLAAAVSLISACDENDARTPRSAHPVPTAVPPPSGKGIARMPDLGPIETIETLRSHRRSGRYSRIEPNLLPQQRSAVIAQIRSVDRLAAAARVFRGEVGKQFGMSAAQEFDYTQVVNILGVLSQDVTLLTERIIGDRAEVSFQVCERVPLETAHLIRNEGRWTLVDDPIEGVAETLLKLAFLLERVTAQLGEKPFTLEELRREITLRQTPILRRLERIVTGDDSADARTRSKGS